MQDAWRLTLHREMSLTITFISGAFSPRLPESSQIRPGLYGFELAYWLAQHLEGAGFKTGYPEPERAAWAVGVSGPNEDEFVLKCRSTAPVEPNAPRLWEVAIRAYGDAQPQVVRVAVVGALRRLNIEPLTPSADRRVE